AGLQERGQPSYRAQRPELIWRQRSMKKPCESRASLLPRRRTRCRRRLVSPECAGKLQRLWTFRGDRMKRGVALMLLSLGSLSAHAATDCQGSVMPQPLAVRPTVLSPVAAGFAVVNPQLASQRGVLAPDYDETQSVDNVLWRLKVEGCRSLAAAPAATATPAGYVKKTEFDDTDRKRVG